MRAIFFVVFLAASELAAAANCTVSASNTWTGLTAACGFTPTSADNITISGNTTLTVNTNTAAAASILIGSANTSGATLAFNANSQVTVAGNVQFGNGGGNRNGSINMTNGGTLSAGSFTVSNVNAWTPGTGTVILTGTNTLPNNTAFDTFNNLTIGSNTTTLSRATAVSGNLTVNGTLTGAQTLTLNGNNTTLDGVGSITITTLSITTGSKSIASTANLAVSATLAISGAIAVTNNGTLTTTAAGGITGTVAGTTWTNAAGSTLSITGALLATGTLNATVNANTVIYAGAAQAIKTASSNQYYHLTLSGSGIKTPAAAFTALGTLTIGSGVTLAGTTLTLTVNGNVSNAGTHTATAATGTITLSGGTASHTLSGSGTYANLVMNDTNGASLSASPTVSGVLTLTSGVITTGANTLITSASCPGSVSRSSGHINGNLQLNFPTGAQSCAFHVGDNSSTNYTPVTVTFTNVSGAGGLIGGAASGDYSDSGSPVDNARSVNRYWTLQLPGSGALTFSGSYSTAFTYFAGDNDGSTTPAQYIIGKGDSCSPSCTWTMPTVSGTPTNTSATATGMTSFSVFVVGHIKIAHFAISVPASPFSTCNASASITITAQDAANATVTNYNGTVNISTSPADGDWSLTTGNGTLTNSGPGFSGVADDGKATYNFTPSDNGVVTLSLSNILVDSDVTITVVDSNVSSSSTTSAAIQYRGNQLAITNDTIQVANKPQSMKITRTRGASCSTAVPGSANLKAWYTTDADHPAGATAPAITGASPAITTSVPGSNNLSVTFNGSGEAAITLTTSDVGKYVINVRDDSAGTVNGTSPTITTSPFALVVSGISKGITNNQGGTSTAGVKFVAAGETFQVTVDAYQWSPTADLDNNGIPDAGATVAQITAQSKTLRFAWPVTIGAATPITPVGGTTGTISNGSISSAAFSGGSATPANLSYSEVGSVTLTVTASSYLNTGAAFVVGSNGIVVDGAGGRTGVVGRFYPDHFTLVSSDITPACGAGVNAFTYMGQAFTPSFTVQARSAADTLTTNYRHAGHTFGSTTVSMLAENNNNGVDLSARLTGPSSSWSGGILTSNTTATFNRAISPDGAFDLLQIGVVVTDSEGAVLANRDMEASTSGVCAPCTGKAIGTGPTKVRFGRLREQNAVASSGAITLPVPVALQYWSGSAFTTSTADTCTTIAQASVALDSTGLTGGATSVLSNPVTFTSGTGFIRLDKPGTGAKGYVLVTPTAPSYLQGNWDGSANWNQNPTARAAWGVFGSQPQNFIYQRENY